MRPLLVRIITSLFLLLSGTSCVKDIIMDAKEKPQVAVVCILSDNPVQELRLTFTKWPSLKEAPQLIEAKGVLKDLNTMESRDFKRQEDGVWRLDYAAVPGHRYRLEVAVPGYESIYSESKMPDKPRVYLQRWYWLENIVESPTGYYVEPHHPDTYFYGVYWNDGDNVPCGETFFGVCALNEPVWIYAVNYNPVTGKREIVDDICTDYGPVDDFNLTGRVYTSPQWEEPIPYRIRPQYAEQLADTHIKVLYPWLDGKPMHRRYIRIKRRDQSDFFNSQGIFVPLGFGVSGSFTGKHNCSSFTAPHYNVVDVYGYVNDLAEDEGYVVWTAVSEELDDYLKDAYKTQELYSSTDLTTIYLRDNMPSNIKQGNGAPGLGLFGARIERKYQWSSDGTYVDYDRSQEPQSFAETVQRSFVIPVEEREELFGY